MGVQLTNLGGWVGLLSQPCKDPDPGPRLFPCTRRFPGACSCGALLSPVLPAWVTVPKASVSSTEASGTCQGMRTLGQDRTFVESWELDTAKSDSICPASSQCGSQCQWEEPPLWSGLGLRGCLLFGSGLGALTANTEMPLHVEAMPGSGALSSKGPCHVLCCESMSVSATDSLGSQCS